MYKPKVSIVIPVYNAEKYLSESLDSLINQTLKEVEVICVDDGSTDNSSKILDEYAQKDSRIKVFHKENEGVSIARNFGIRKVQGEYLTFVDSDDWLELNALEILYNTASQRESDLLLFSYYFHYPNSITKNNQIFEFGNKIKDKNTTFLESYDYIFSSPMGVLSKFYKTKLIKENEIYFPENIQCGEDRPFYISACIAAKKISVLDKPFYYYRQNVKKSLTQGNSNMVSGIYKSNKMIKEMVYNFQDKKKIFLAYLDEYIRSLLWAWNMSELKSYRLDDIKYLKLVKKECLDFKNYPNFPQVSYDRLLKTINDFNMLSYTKLLEPIFEFEHRQKRIVIYLGGYQIINIPNWIK